MPTEERPVVVAPEIQPVVIRLPVDLHAALKQRARADDLSMSQYIRRLLRQELALNS